MRGRRRRRAGATLALVVLAAACGAPDTTSAPSTSSMASGSVTTSPATTSPPSSTSATTTSTTTLTTSTTTTSTTTTSTIATSTTSTTVACRAIDLVVLGNSTDYWPDFVVGVEAPTDDAWPALLEALLRDELPDTEVTVENGSVLGAGFDIGLFGVTSMSEQLDGLAASHDDESAVLFLAPSVVDLQLRSLDVDASFAAFEHLLADATVAFDTVWVLPMNPVASGFDPDVARAVDAFNARLVESGLLAVDARSPLLDDDGLFGRAEFYDDFDDGRLATPGPDPDGLHPDADGHRRLAASVADLVVAELASVCR